MSEISRRFLGSEISLQFFIWVTRLVTFLCVFEGEAYSGFSSEGSLTFLRAETDLAEGLEANNFSAPLDFILF